MTHEGVQEEEEEQEEQEQEEEEVQEEVRTRRAPRASASEAREQRSAAARARLAVSRRVTMTAVAGPFCAMAVSPCVTMADAGEAGAIPHRCARDAAAGADGVDGRSRVRDDDDAAEAERRREAEEQAALAHCAHTPTSTHAARHAALTVWRLAGWWRGCCCSAVWY